MNGKRAVLVTGASGFLGRATVKLLRADGWRVAEAVRGDNGAEGECIGLDLCRPESVLALAGLRFDAVVHLGALVALSDQVQQDLYAPNVLSTGCLAHLASFWGAHMVFASTAIVHGVRAEVINDATPVAPDTPYASSKWLGEQLVRASGARSCTLRLAGIFGAGGPAHLGLNRAIDGACAGVPPTRFGSGLALRNYVYVKDVAETILFVLNERIEGSHLVAGMETFSISDMLQQVCDVLAPTLNPVVVEGGEAKNQVIHPSPVLPPGRNFQEALRDIGNERRR